MKKDGRSDPAVRILHAVGKELLFLKFYTDNKFDTHFITTVNKMVMLIENKIEHIFLKYKFNKPGKNNVYFSLNMKI